MDENMTQTSEVMDADINAAWDDDVTTDSAAAEQNKVQPADQPEHEAQEQPAEEVKQPVDQPELFTIKNRDEVRQVTKEDLIAMAQKGWDYDTVKTERDQLRQYRKDADPALELVKNYAQRNNMSVPEYLDFCRKQDLMHGGMDEKTADQTIQFEKRQADLDAREKRLNAEQVQRDSLLQQAKQRQEAMRSDMNQFLKMYPGVQANEIPKEVWDMVRNGQPLTTAYAMHQNQQLKAELAAERQNKENQKNTPGSLGGNSVTDMDEIDRIWAEDE